MGKVDTIRTEAALTASELEGLNKDKVDKGFILESLHDMDTKYLKRLVNFKRVNNKDGSADFSLQLNLNNK